MSKKGISPVIAEVLLISIGVSAAVSAGVFLQGTIDRVEEGAESQLSREDKEKRSEIQTEYGFNQDGYLLLEIRNSKSRTLQVEEDDQKKWNLYVDGAPSEWNYTESAKQNDDKVLLNTGSTITINTTEAFPSSGNSIETEIAGPYGLSTSYICYSTGTSCES